MKTALEMILRLLTTFVLMGLFFIFFSLGWMLQETNILLCLGCLVIVSFILILLFWIIDIN